MPTVRGLFTARESRVRLNLDGQILEREAFCIMVAKGAYSGGGMRFGSHVALDDGRFEVTLFRPMPVWKMLVKTPKLYSGQLDNEPTIEKLSGSRIEIEADPPILAEVDGDVIGRAAVSMTVLPRRIPLCFPRFTPEQAHAPQFIRLRLRFFCGAADRIKPPAHAFPGTNSRSDRNLERDGTGNRPGIFLVFLQRKKGPVRPQKIGQRIGWRWRHLAGGVSKTNKTRRGSYLRRPAAVSSGRVFSRECQNCTRLSLGPFEVFLEIFYVPIKAP